LVCQDRDCGYRKSTMTMSNARCPDCHKNMELIGDGDNKTFKCACGYREKLLSYTKRRSESVGKNDVKEFLSNQKNENKNKNMNTALADALAKMLGKDK
ncbi:MAG TPA: DNA topoisomerase III, partial [Clostridia bacterium]|nr:DNA topoisomerase III [Clostridia bacterium]